MKNPHRHFAFWMATAIGGLAGVVLCFLLSGSPRWLSATMFLGGLMALIFGTMAAFSSRTQSRLRSSLLKNEDVLARWRVDEPTWRQFVELNRTFNINEVPATTDIPADGVDVLVGRRGMMIDGSVYTFNHQAKKDGVIQSWGGDWTIRKVSLGGDRPCCVYFYAETNSVETTPTCSNLIFPVPSHEMPEARIVLNYFQAMLDSLE